MHWVGICVLCFLIGRAVQRWCDNAPDLERGLYETGYKAGYDACLRANDFWGTFAYMRQRWQNWPALSGKG